MDPLDLSDSTNPILDDDFVILSETTTFLKQKITRDTVNESKFIVQNKFVLS